MAESRRRRISAVLDTAGADLLIATSAENVFYTSGFFSESQLLMRDTETFTLVPRDLSRPVALVAAQADMDLVAEYPPRADLILSYGTFYIEDHKTGLSLSEEDVRLRELVHGQTSHPSPIDAIREAIRHLDLAGKPAAVDETGVQPPTYSALASEIAPAPVSAAGALLRNVRAIKDTDEVAALRQAAWVTVQAIDACLNRLRPGDTELDAVRYYEEALLLHRARPSFSIIAFGERAVHPNALPSSRRLRGGDVVRFDVGCRWNWYHADLARTAVVGAPPEWLRTGFEAMVAGELAGLSALRPGARASEVFGVTVDRVREAGVPGYRRHHVGHGIGVELYDVPLLGPKDHTILQAGMVVNVETPYYLLGVGGIQVEDTAVVSDDGAELLTCPQHELRVL